MGPSRLVSQASWQMDSRLRGNDDRVAESVPHKRKGPPPPARALPYYPYEPVRQAEAATPLSAISWVSSPLSYISIMMSEPPTNSPFT